MNWSPYERISYILDQKFHISIELYCKDSYLNRTEPKNVILNFILQFNVKPHKVQY